MRAQKILVWGLTLTSLLFTHVSLATTDAIYVAEQQKRQITIVQTDGTLQPFATNVGLGYVNGLAQDSATGDFYVTALGNNAIRKIAPNGSVSAFVSGSALAPPGGLAVDNNGVLYAASTASATITQITPSGQMTTFSASIPGCTLGGSYSLAFDASGNLYGCNQGARAVVKISTSHAITVLTTNINSPVGLAFDKSGILYVASVNQSAINKISSDGKVTLFGTGLNMPSAIAFDSDENLYVCCIGDGRLVKITPDGQTQTVVTGLSYPTAIVISPPPPPQTIVRLPNAFATNGIVTVPITMVTQGKENALTFSLNYDQTRLSLSSVTWGRNANGTLLCNSNSPGRLGIGFSLGTGGAFPAGTQEIVKVVFNTSPVNNTTVTALTFGDVPAVRQVSDAQGEAITAAYVDGTVTLSVGIEGDVTGDGKVTATDWVRVGRMVAGMEPAADIGEFQCADCAPRSTAGDGLLTVADWVQAGRYALGMDPRTFANGPTASTNPPPPNSAAQLQVASALTSPRSLSILNTKTQPRQTLQLPVCLNAQGNENAVGFSVTFDPSILSFTGATLGNGAQGATLNVNDSGSKNGTIGFALALPTGTTFANAAQEIVKLNFATTTSPTASTKVGFSSRVVVQQVVDTDASVLAATYVPASVNIISPADVPLLSMTPSSGNLVLSWPVPTLDVILESTDSLGSTNWVPVTQVSVTNANSVLVTVPISQAQRFYRLHAR